MQDALKNGSATCELLTGEISRIEAFESRAKELAREKVQTQVYNALSSQLADPENVCSLTLADLVSARLLVYQALTWSVRSHAHHLLFPETDTSDTEDLYTALASLPDEKYALLIRLALTGKPESKNPAEITGTACYRMAAGAGVDVETIEYQQQEKTRAKDKIKALEKKAKKLSQAA